MRLLLPQNDLGVAENVHHAEHAHEAIKGSRLISFYTGGHGLLFQMDAVRQDVKAFLGQ